MASTGWAKPVVREAGARDWVREAGVREAGASAKCVSRLRIARAAGPVGGPAGAARSGWSCQANGGGPAGGARRAVGQHASAGMEFLPVPGEMVGCCADLLGGSRALAGGLGGPRRRAARPPEPGSAISPCAMGWVGRCLGRRVDGLGYRRRSSGYGDAASLGGRAFGGRTLAPGVGLEPTTQRLTAACSTN